MTDKEKVRFLKEEVRTLYDTVVAITGKIDWALPPSLDLRFAEEWKD